jgi:hypothetical protein
LEWFKSVLTLDSKKMAERKDGLEASENGLGSVDLRVSSTSSQDSPPPLPPKPQKYKIETMEVAHIKSIPDSDLQENYSLPVLSSKPSHTQRDPLPEWTLRDSLPKDKGSHTSSRSKRISAPWYVQPQTEPETFTAKLKSIVFSAIDKVKSYISPDQDSLPPTFASSATDSRRFSHAPIKPPKPIQSNVPLLPHQHNEEEGDHQDVSGAIVDGQHGSNIDTSLPFRNAEYTPEHLQEKESSSNGLSMKIISTASLMKDRAVQMKHATLNRIEQGELAHHASRILSSTKSRLVPPPPAHYANGAFTDIEAMPPSPRILPRQTRGESSFAFWQIARPNSGSRVGVFWDGDQRHPYFFVLYCISDWNYSVRRDSK